MRMRMLALAFLLGSVCPGFAADLALKRVMLSSAGVGYFEYEADVDGTATLGLDVPLDQVDDVLTSLVVFDSAGGVGTVELPGRDNTRASFGDLPFGPDALRSPIDTLNSLQGVEIAVQGPRPMTGRIVHAEPRYRDAASDTGQPPAIVQRTRVTLLGADGLRQFVLEDADSIQVTDPGLRARIGARAGIAAPRGQPEHAPHHAAQQRHRPAHGARRLRRRRAAVEGVLSAGAAGEGRRSRAPARLGGAGEPVGRRLERRRADAAIRQSGHVPAGDLPQLLRAAAGSAGGDPGPHPAERGHARPAGADGVEPSGRGRACAAFAAAPARRWRRRSRRAMAPPSEQVQAAEGVGGNDLPAADAGVRSPPAIPPACRSSTAPCRPQRVDLATGNDPHPLSADPHHQRHRRVAAGRRADAVRRSPAPRPSPATPGSAVCPTGESRLLSFAQDLRTTVERDSKRADDPCLADRRRRACCTSRRGSARCCASRSPRRRTSRAACWWKFPRTAIAR